MLDKVRTGPCFHCQAPLPAGEALVREKDGELQQFCCHGCLAAAQLIETLHLESFYRYREQCAVEPAGATSRQSPPTTASIDFSRAVRTLPDGKREWRLFIPDIRCAACVWLLEQSLGKQAGVRSVHLHFATRRLQLECDPRVEDEAILGVIRALGYTPLPLASEERRARMDAQRRDMLTRLGVAGLGMMPVMMFALASYLAGPATPQNPASGMDPLYEQLLRWASLALSVPVVFYSALPFHRAALNALRQRHLSMDLPVSLAILAAFTLSVVNTLRFGSTVYFDTACMFAFFLLIGRTIELYSQQHFQNNEDALLRLLPGTVTRVQRRGETIVGSETVALSCIAAGDIVQVAPGEAIPVDGIVVEGSSSVSDAAFTGEAFPSLRTPGSRVLAGAHNHENALLVRASAAPDDFFIAQIERLYEQASRYRPHWSLIADRAAAGFIAGVLVLSVGAGVFWYFAGSADFLVIALTVLVVACPCALSLATPVASTIATTTLRRKGLLIRHGAFLERLAKTDAVVFDKTGTLTHARLVLRRVVPLEALSPAQCVALATALERHSKHPIAEAFTADTPLLATDVSLVSGEGLEGVIEGCRYRLGRASFVLPGASPLAAPDAIGRWILLASDRPLAWFLLEDDLRTDAAEVMAALRARGLMTAILTGDSSAQGEALAQSLKVDSLATGQSPQGKIEAIRRWGNTHTVLMVGDGVNDAGAMAAAACSLAVAPRDVIVQQSADATLLSPSLKVLPEILDYAKRTRRIIRQNVAWSLCYNFTAIPLALLGVLPPWLAAIGMSLSSVLVVADASRLRGGGG